MKNKNKPPPPFGYWFFFFFNSFLYIEPTVAGDILFYLKISHVSLSSFTSPHHSSHSFISLICHSITLCPSTFFFFFLFFFPPYCSLPRSKIQGSSRLSLSSRLSHLMAKLEGNDKVG